MRSTERPGVYGVKHKNVGTLHKRKFEDTDPEMAPVARDQNLQETAPPGASSEPKLPVPKWKPQNSVLRRLSADPDPFHSFHRRSSCWKKRILEGTFRRLGLTKFAEIDFLAQPREKFVSYILQMEIDEEGRVGGADPYSGRTYHRTDTELCDIFGFRLPAPTKEPDWATIDHQSDGPGWRQMLCDSTGKFKLTAVYRGKRNAYVQVKDISDEVFRSWLLWSSMWLQGKPNFSACPAADFNVAWELWSGRLHPLSVLMRSLRGSKYGSNATSTAIAACVFAHAMGNFIVPVTPKEIWVWDDWEEQLPPPQHHHWTRLSSKRQKKEEEYSKRTAPADECNPSREQPPTWKEPVKPSAVKRETCRSDGQYQKRGRPPGRKPKNANADANANANAPAPLMSQSMDDLVIHYFRCSSRTPAQTLEIIAPKDAFVAARALSSTPAASAVRRDSVAEEGAGTKFDQQASRGVPPRPQQRERPFVRKCKLEPVPEEHDDAGTDPPLPMLEPAVVEKMIPRPSPSLGHPQPWGTLTMDKLWENFTLEKSSRVLAQAEQEKFKSRLDWAQVKLRDAEDALRNREIHWKATYEKECASRVQAERLLAAVTEGATLSGAGQAGQPVQRAIVDSKVTVERLDRLQLVESALHQRAERLRKTTDEKNQLVEWINALPATIERLKQDLFDKMENAKFEGLEEELPKTQSTVAGGTDKPQP